MCKHPPRAEKRPGAVGRRGEEQVEKLGVDERRHYWRMLGYLFPYLFMSGVTVSGDASTALSLFMLESLFISA
jgi:hypothetical protein